MKPYFTKLFKQLSIKDSISLLFPEICAACSVVLFKNEQHLCLKCVKNLPQSKYHEHSDKNVMWEKLYNRTGVNHVAAFYRFKKGERIQNLLHGLKYGGNEQLGIFVGSLYGEKLKNTVFAQASLIIPVPLHPLKQAKRGYNQSECFANGLSEILQIPVDTNVLARGQFTDTQTKRSRFERFLNMKETFILKNGEGIENKHVILVDDVVTTGSTIEACVRELKKIENIQVSVLAIAYAN